MHDFVVSKTFLPCMLWCFSVFFLGGGSLGPQPLHMEVPRLGVRLERQLSAYPTVTAMPDPSFVCNLHHSSWQLGI